MTKEQLQRIAEAHAGEKMPDFRTFYGKFYHPGSGTHWAGGYGEMTHSVMQRVMDAVADYTDFVFMLEAHIRQTST